MKSILSIIIAIFCFTTLVYSQDIEQIVEDGLVLSYYLGENDFKSIEAYLKKHSYQFVSDNSNNADPNMQSYYKTLNEDKGEGITLIFDMRMSSKGENQYRVAISYTNASRGSFFIQKLRKWFENHSQFKKVENVFVFLVPKDKEDIPEEPKDFTETVNYYSFIDLDKIAIFYPPDEANKYLDWSYYIPKYVALE